MQINPIQLVLIPHQPFGYATVSAVGSVIDAAAEGVCYFVEVAKAEKLTYVYVFVTAVTGTGSAITMTCTLRAATSVTGVSTQVTGYSTTAACRNTGGGWVRFEFTDAGRATLVAGTSYFVCIQTNADGTNNCAVATSGATVDVESYSQWASYTTTNSFSSVSLVARNGVPLVIKLADGTIQGSPYTKLYLDTDNTNSRGLYIPALNAPMTIRSIAAAHNPFNGAELWIPGAGSPVVTRTAVVGLSGFGILNDKIELPAGQDYRLVMTYTGASRRPGSAEIEDPDDWPDLLAARLFGGWHRTELIGGTWTDQPKRYPSIALMLDVPFPAPATGSPIRRVLRGSVIGGLLR